MPGAFGVVVSAFQAKRAIVPALRRIGPGRLLIAVPATTRPRRVASSCVVPHVSAATWVCHMARLTEPTPKPASPAGRVWAGRRSPQPSRTSVPAPGPGLCPQLEGHAPRRRHRTIRSRFPCSAPLGHTYPPAPPSATGIRRVGGPSGRTLTSRKSQEGRGSHRRAQVLASDEDSPGFAGRASYSKAASSSIQRGPLSVSTQPMRLTKRSSWRKCLGSFGSTRHGRVLPRSELGKNSGGVHASLRRRRRDQLLRPAGRAAMCPEPL